jgi:hypothetical protein
LVIKIFDIFEARSTNRNISKATEKIMYEQFLRKLKKDMLHEALSVIKLSQQKKSKFFCPIKMDHSLVYSKKRALKKPQLESHISVIES